jgi:hypothetical protein
MVRPARSPRGLTALALALVAVAGGLCLALPFWGDQALFTIYGRELTRGAVLYRDVFDVKQPGIFVFYAIGGSLFGFTEVGIHLFELIYWLAFSVFVVKALRPYFSAPWAPPLVPVFTIVVYYFSAGLLDLTQVEILVAFPILLAWWLIDRARPGTRVAARRYAAAGLAAAAVVLLKHLYVLIVLAFLAYAVVRARRDGTPTRDVVRLLGWFAAALVLPLVAVASYFAAYGQLGRIWWAYVQLSSAAQLTGSRPFSYLVFGARRFLIGEGAVLILAAIGCVDVLRERVRPKADLVIGMMLWVVVGAIAFLIQGWPEYKWSLFTVPVGILGVTGVEALVRVTRPLRGRARLVLVILAVAVAVMSLAIATSPRIQTLLLASILLGASAGIAALVLVHGAGARRVTLWLLLAMLSISAGVAAVAPIRKADVLAEHDFAASVEARAELRRSLNDAYLAADRDLEALRRDGAVPGPIYVFGDPIVILRSLRTQGAPIPGWGPEFLDTRAWRELYGDLRSRPPAYIVVDRYVGSFVESRFPKIMSFIRSAYEVAFVGESGTWYRRR